MRGCVIERKQSLGGEIRQSVTVTSLQRTLFSNEANFDLVWSTACLPLFSFCAALHVP